MFNFRYGEIHDLGSYTVRCHEIQAREDRELTQSVSVPVREGNAIVIVDRCHMWTVALETDGTVENGEVCLALVLPELNDVGKSASDPHSVNTIRIITYLTKDGQPKIIGSRLRMGRHGNLVDNISQGGIHASVDLKTGRIMSGLVIASREEASIAAHPDTGTNFLGVEIPFWDPILDLCRKAAAATPFQRFVGWDIAVGTAGPVLIEGNSTGVEVAYDQVSAQGFMTAAFRRDMLEYGIRFPERLPGISPRRVYQSYKISRRMDKISHG